MNNAHHPHEPNGSRPEEAQSRLTALPVQLIETDNGVILKRGCVELRIAGDRAAQAVELVLATLDGPGATVEEVCARFAAPDRPAIEQLIGKLAARQIVIPAGERIPAADPEGPLDIFYWHFGTEAASVNERLEGLRIVVIGVNGISRQLAGSFIAAGVSSVEVIDYPALRNLSFFDEAGVLDGTRWNITAIPTAWADRAEDIGAGEFDCLVATSDFGGMQGMRQWNELCVRRGRHFLPVVLQDLIGYIGPSVIPGETACFECLLSRLKSNTIGVSIETASSAMAFEGQQVSGFHPSMASILGDITVMELTKFYSRALPLWKVGTFMEVNLLAAAIDSHKVLRVPRCRVCSNLIHRSTSSLVKGSLESKVVAE